MAEGAAEEGLVKEILDKGALSYKERRKELEERGVAYKQAPKSWVWWIGNGSFIIWAVLCFLPAVSKLSGQKALNYFAQLDTIEFPAFAIYISFILLLTLIGFGFIWAPNLRVNKGGCHSEDDTLILIREGPYKVVRHPSDFA